MKAFELKYFWGLSKQHVSENKKWTVKATAYGLVARPVHSALFKSLSLFNVTEAIHIMVRNWKTLL